MNATPSTSPETSQEMGSEQLVSGPDKLLMWMFVMGFIITGLILLADLVIGLCR